MFAFQIKVGFSVPPFCAPAPYVQATKGVLGATKAPKHKTCHVSHLSPVFSFFFPCYASTKGREIGFEPQNQKFLLPFDRGANPAAGVHPVVLDAAFQAMAFLHGLDADMFIPSAVAQIFRPGRPLRGPSGPNHWLH